MELNPFSAISSYAAMLNKIAIFSFFVLLAALAFVFWQVPTTRNVIPQLEAKVPGTDIQVPLSVLIGALILATVFRVIKLHDRISDCLGIRRRFDVLCILLPMASAAGEALSLDQQEKVWQNRHALMRVVFYKYASSSKGRAQIEEHAITMALDQWSWYWIIVEAIFIITVLGIFMMFVGNPYITVLAFALCLSGIWLLQGVKELCRRYARDEISQIMEEPTRLAAIQAVFHAL